MNTNKRFQILTVAFFALMIFGMIVLYRFAQRHAVIEKELVVNFSQDVSSSMRIRVPAGKSFALLLEVPVERQTNGWDFAGEIVIKQMTNIIWRAELKPAALEFGDWIKQQSIQEMTVKGVTAQDLPLLSRQEYDLSVTATNLAGCSLWLQRFTVGGDRSRLVVYQYTNADALP